MRGISPRLAADCLKLAGVPSKPARKTRANGVCVVPVPPSTNNLFATYRGRRIPSREYKAWLSEAVPILSRDLEPLTTMPVQVRYTLFGKVNLSRDIGNLEKALTDAVVKAGLIADDSLRAGLWRIVLDFDDQRSGDVAGVEVRILEKLL